MDTLTLRLELRSPFGSPLLGDMLFGQLCWALRHRHGERHLQERLDGYVAGRPFAVVSDAMPVGYLPRPALPLSLFPEVPGADRKQVKKRVWLPLAALERPMTEWLEHCQSEAELVAACAPPEQANAPLAPHPKAITVLHPQPHNSINRLTGTTGRGEFAPYTQMQRWSAEGVALCLRLVFDAERISAETLTDLFNDIGTVGFGRDASIGLGKFEVEPMQVPWPSQSDPNTCLTLAPCAPQRQGCRADRSYYEVFTRFGRHGDQAVQLGNPFKTPVLMARAGALLTPSRLPNDPILGQGLGGDGRLSKVIPETVQQGYAPCVAVHLPEEIAP
jgi:CRISPR-associated protein Csm4